MNHYSVLRIARTATLADIKAAYRKLALAYHPDRTGGSEEKSKKFVEITAAYNVLIDPVQRAAYDRTLRPEREVEPPRTIPRPRQVWCFFFTYYSG
jgi:DnaJ-class molecular chaperone